MDSLAAPVGARQQWDGDKWVLISDEWIKPDWSLTRPLIEASAAAYADEKGVALRECADQ